MKKELKLLGNYFGKGLLFGIGLFLGIFMLYAWQSTITNDTVDDSLKADSGDFLTLDKWNGLVQRVSGVETATSGNVGIGVSSPSEKLEVNGNIKVTGNVIPNGFTVTNGVVHTSLYSAMSHSTAKNTCSALAARVCSASDYRIADLGWYDNTDQYADDHLFWDGGTSWNTVTSCVGSCSVGSTVEAGSHDGNQYTLYNYTPCADRCSRTLQFACCK